MAEIAECLIFLVILLLTGGADAAHAPIQLRAGQRASGRAVYTGSVAPQSRCSLLCLSSAQCAAFDYNTKTRTCQLYEKIQPIQELVDDPDYIYGALEMRSCQMLLERGISQSGEYIIDPDGYGVSEDPFTVTCSMPAAATGSAATIVGHDSERRTHVNGFDPHGSYSISVTYAAPLPQLEALMSMSSRCSQFIRYECYHSILSPSFAWWVSRSGERMNYWGGAQPGSGKCACGMTNSCVNPAHTCNCQSNDAVWRSDEGSLEDKSTLPVVRMHFGDTGGGEEGYHTLGKLICYG